MAHAECFYFVEYVKNLFPQYFDKKYGLPTLEVLEVGSLNINGSVRQFFDAHTYMGVDIGEGVDVDIVLTDPQKLPFPNNSFDVVVSTEMFEHNPYWDYTYLEMHRVLRPRGMMLFTCATIGRQEHGTATSIPGASPLTVAKPEFSHYYRNLQPMDFDNVEDPRILFNTHSYIKNESSSDLYFVGFKHAIS